MLDRTLPPESRPHFHRFQPIGRESDDTALFRRSGRATDAPLRRGGHASVRFLPAPTAAGTLDRGEDAGLPVSRPAARQWGKHEPHRRPRAPRQAPTEEEACGVAPRCPRSSPWPASAALGAPTNRRPLPLLWPTTTASRPSDTVEGRDLSGQPQRWAMYVRWPSGRRETIFTEFPDQVAQLRCWVLARLPLPKITAAPGWV